MAPPTTIASSSNDSNSPSPTVSRSTYVPGLLNDAVVFADTALPNVTVSGPETRVHATSGVSLGPAVSASVGASVAEFGSWMRWIATAFTSGGKFVWAENEVAPLPPAGRYAIVSRGRCEIVAALLVLLHMGCRCWIGGVGLLAIALSTGQLAVAEPLRVMSFNIRYGTADDGGNSWPKRRELLFGVLTDEAPHVIGMQEAERFQLDELREALPNYGEVGVGRDDGKMAGEYSPILYDKRRLELLDQETFWFADEPSKPGAIAWGAHLPRVCTWILARDKVTGREFYFYNMHWDHESQNARQRSADLLLERIAGREQPKAPVVVTGDFNADEANPAFVRLVSSKRHGLTDTFRQMHPQQRAVKTFHNFQGGSDRGGKIDAVLVSPEWEVKAAEIVRTQRDGRYPSDHYPVSAEIEFPAAK